ncbi:MAG: hypothetical protein KKC03_13280 [Bacteroidetes bacterium]|nr:hypothetical protein [Bacteroidota bacterium]
MRAKSIDGKDLVTLSAGTTMKWWASKRGNGWIFINDRHIVREDPTLGPFDTYEQSVVEAKAHEAAQKK